MKNEEKAWFSAASGINFLLQSSTVLIQVNEWQLSG